MTNDSQLDAARADLYKGCIPRQDCRACGPASRPFYRVIRTSIDTETVCPCPCHRQGALDNLIAVARATPSPDAPKRDEGHIGPSTTVTNPSQDDLDVVRVNGCLRCGQSCCDVVINYEGNNEYSVNCSGACDESGSHEWDATSSPDAGVVGELVK